MDACDTANKPQYTSTPVRFTPTQGNTPLHLSASLLHKVTHLFASLLHKVIHLYTCPLNSCRRKYTLYTCLLPFFQGNTPSSPVRFTPAQGNTHLHLSSSLLHKVIHFCTCLLHYYTR